MMNGNALSQFLTMNVLIRADASVRIGSGHVMRCLTLASELRKNGATVGFVCRDWAGSLFHTIEQQGFAAYYLPPCSSELSHSDTDYTSWLGVPLDVDASQTGEVCQSYIEQHGAIDWLIVDHYALDERWETQLRPFVKRIFCIDDIANRRHDCDVLLDQNLYDNPETRYADKIPNSCLRLLGPCYALLREEFRLARQHMMSGGLLRERNGKIQRIFVFFGGSDATNETAKVLAALKLLNRSDIAVDVVVGVSNPHRMDVEALCAELPYVTYHCQVSNMAVLMAQADIAIGAGGSTTWERCCLGLPTLAVILASNQREMTETAARYGVQWNLGWYYELTPNHIAKAIKERISKSEELRQATELAQILVDGCGTERVAEILTKTIQK